MINYDKLLCTYFTMFIYFQCLFFENNIRRTSADIDDAQG